VETAGRDSDEDKKLPRWWSELQKLVLFLERDSVVDVKAEYKLQSYEQPCLPPPTMYVPSISCPALY
jgi:hypothetical protein